MKSSIQLKDLYALPAGVAQVIHATAPAIQESSPLPAPESIQNDRGFREMLHRRHTTPYSVVFPYQHGGLNE